MPFPAMTSRLATGWMNRPPSPGYECSCITCHQRSKGTLTTLPPSRSMAASLVAGAWSGTTTVASTPSSRALHATPCAMLPALAV